MLRESRQFQNIQSAMAKEPMIQLNMLTVNVDAEKEEKSSSFFDTMIVAGFQILIVLIL